MIFFPYIFFVFFFFHDTATTEIYTLSLHDALPIHSRTNHPLPRCAGWASRQRDQLLGNRSEEHTSELQSLAYLVCRLLLEKKKKNDKKYTKIQKKKKNTQKT